MRHDVFLSYSSPDREKAERICAAIEARGIRCWMAPRDILPGRSYAQALIEALHASRALVLVFSESTNASRHVENELERAVSMGIPIVPVRISDVKPMGAMEYLISSSHWFEATSDDWERRLSDLGDQLSALLARVESSPAAPRTKRPPRPGRRSRSGAAHRRDRRWLVAGGAGLVLCAGLALVWLARGAEQGAAETNPTKEPPADRDPEGDESVAKLPPLLEYGVGDGRLEGDLSLTPESDLEAYDDVGGLAVAADGRVAYSMKHTLAILSRAEHGGLHEWKQSHRSRELRGVAFSPTGDLLAIGMTDGRVGLMEPSSDEGIERAFLIPDRIIREVAFPPAGPRVAVATSRGSWVITIDESEPPFALDGDTDDVLAIAADPRGSFIATAVRPAEIRVWSWNLVKSRSWDAAKLVGEGGAGIESLAFAPDGRTIAAAVSGAGGGWLLLLDVAKDRPVLVLALPSIPRAAAWSHDPSLFALGLEDGRLVVLESPEGRLVADVQTEQGPISVARWALDGADAVIWLGHRNPRQPIGRWRLHR